MSSENNRSKNLYEGDEVNLTPFFLFIGRFLKRIGASISYLFRLAFRNIRIVVLFAIVGVGISIINFYLIERPKYKTSLILVSNLLSDEFCGSLIETLHELSKEKNYAMLSEKLDLPLDITMNISRIKYLKYQAAAPKDTMIGSPFSIQVVVYDNTILDTLQASLITYLENNEYALKRKSVRNAVLLDFSAKMEQDLADLDTIVKKASVGLITSGLDPIETYKKVISVHYEKFLMKEKIALLNNFEVISGFTKFKKPSSPRLFRDSVVLGFVFAWFGVFYSMYREKKQPNAEKRIISNVPNPENHKLVDTQN